MNERLYVEVEDKIKPKCGDNLLPSAYVPILTAFLDSLPLKLIN